MSESIITAESLNNANNEQKANEQQDKKMDSPDENKDENLETTESADDASEETQPESDESIPKEESLEDEENVEADSQNDADESEEEQDLEDKSDKPEIPKWAEKRLSRERRKHEREIGELKKQYEQIASTVQQNAINYDQNTQMVDPFTGNIVDINSVEGQVALKLQQAAQIAEQQEQQQKTQQAQGELKRKLDKGYDKFDDFEEVVVNAGISKVMLEAASLSDSPDELLYNLAKYKSDDIDRISKLSPERQFREMVLLETKMKQSTKKKIVKKVPEPPSKIKGSGASVKDMHDMSFEDHLKLAKKAEREKLRR